MRLQHLLRVRTCSSTRHRQRRISPRSGGGTTTIATNLAVALAQRTPDGVVLVDLNVRFGHVPVLLNIGPRTSLASISAVTLRQMDRENLDSLSDHARRVVAA